MQATGAVIREQGTTFAVVVVQPHVVSNSHEASNAVAAFTRVFGGIPVILMAQDGSGRPTYYGRPDIARFISSVPLQAVPWKRYTIN
jgi:hypothetical protein